MDITTLAAANAYTDEKVAEGGGAKVIDLTKYIGNISGQPDNVLTFNDAILSAFSNPDTKNIELDDNTTFWDDINTDLPVKYKIDISKVAQDVFIECTANTIMKRDNNAINSESTFFFVDGFRVMKITFLASKSFCVNGWVETTFLVIVQDM